MAMLVLSHTFHVMIPLLTCQVATSSSKITLVSNSPVGHTTEMHEANVTGTVLDDIEETEQLKELQEHVGADKSS